MIMLSAVVLYPTTFGKLNGIKLLQFASHRCYVIVNNTFKVVRSSTINRKRAFNVLLLEMNKPIKQMIPKMSNTFGNKSVIGLKLY